VAELVSRGYQYWALGHVHDYKILSENPWVVYPGNLQGRTIRECGAKGGVVVEVGDGEVKDVQRLIVDRARWAIVNVDAAGLEGEADLFGHIEEAIQDALEECPLLLIRVRITGPTELHRALRAKLPEIIQEVQARADHCREDIWVESVILETTEIINLDAASSEASSDAEEAISSLDLSTALDPLLDAPETLAAAKELSNLLRSKLPGGIDAEAILSDSAMNALLLEARDTLVGRALS
jgi:DNA repair exonuclease SbcCD nuclease subunit